MSIINIPAPTLTEKQEEAIQIGQQVESLYKTTYAMLRNILLSAYEGEAEDINERLGLFSEEDYLKLKALSAGLKQILESAEAGSTEELDKIESEGEAKRVV